MTKEGLPEYPKGQEILFERELNLPVSADCEILKIAVTEASDDDLTYRGALELMDHVEQMRGTYLWVAKPGIQRHKVLDRVYSLDIDPTPAYWSFARLGMFTLQPSVDNDIRHQIVHALIELNPSIPFTEPEPEPQQPPLL